MASLSKVYKPLAAAVRYIQSISQSYGFKVQINSGYRSKVSQAQLAAEGGSYPVATPGRSQHQYGFAVDLQAVPWEYQNTLANWMQSAGAYWGGSSDPVHFSVFNPSEWALRLGYVEKPPTNFTQPLTSAAALSAAGIQSSYQISYPGKIVQVVYSQPTPLGSPAATPQISVIPVSDSSSISRAMAAPSQIRGSTLRR